MTEYPSLNKQQKLVLNQLNDYNAIPASTISDRTGLSRYRVTRIRKQLASLDLCYYTWTTDEDGPIVSGSGYVLTELGSKVQKFIREDPQFCKHDYNYRGKIEPTTLVYECRFCGDSYENDVS